MSNFINNTYTVNAVRANSWPAHRQPYPQHENLQHCVGILITGTRPSNGWRPAPSRPPEAAHLVLTASLTLPTLPAPPPKSATPNQGLPTSTSSEPPQRSSPTSAPLMPYGQPCLQHPHCKCRRDNLITGMQKTSSPASAPLMPYGRPFHQHRHRHRLRDKIIAGIQKTSWPTSVPMIPYDRSFRQFLHRQLLSTYQSMPRGLYHRWRQRLWPCRPQEHLQPHCQHHQPTCNSYVRGAFIKTLAELATVLVGEWVNMYLAYLAYITFTWLPINKALHSLFWVSSYSLFPMHTSHNAVDAAETT